MVDVEWEDPPDEVLFRHENRGGKYVDFALALRQQPGRWAKMPEGYTTTNKSAQGGAQSIRRGALKGFDRGYYDAIADGGLVRVRCKPVDEWPKDGPWQLPEPGSANKPPPLENDPSTIDPKIIRSWARTNGWPDLSDRGRLSEDILNGYRAAHSLPDD